MGERVRVWGMRNGISITVSRPDPRRLQALVADRNASQKHVWRAEIVLLTADGLGTNEIMRLCVPKTSSRFYQVPESAKLRDDRVYPFCSGRAGRAVQVEQPA